MSTQRPFFGNFFAIFRAHTPHIPKTTASVSAAASTTAASSPQSLWATAAAASLSKQLVQDKQATSPRPINAKSSPYNAQATTAAQDRQLQNSLSPPLQHNVTPQTHLPRTPSTGSLPSYGPQNRPQPSYPTVHEARAARRARRGSASSSDSAGFRDVRAGGEKWFIGGITSSGEEKYYKLGMVRRERSADRISADQLSL